MILVKLNRYNSVIVSYCTKRDIIVMISLFSAISVCAYFTNQKVKSNIVFLYTFYIDCYNIHTFRGDYCGNYTTFFCTTL